MPRFLVLPTNQSFAPAEIDAPDAAPVLTIVQQLACKEAKVMRDDTYCFSVRLDANGMWTIFQRDDDEPEGIEAFG
jgi:hypothetical protein